jgi:benzodiazapine receptor
MKSARWLPFVLLLVLALAAAAIGGAATATGVHTWYVGLQKPSWNPPNWLFAPVWGLLYILMAFATWMAWREGDPKMARRTIALYGAQLTLNALWSVLFFGLHRIGDALCEIVVLWALLIFIQVRLWRIRRTAGLLWLPYLAWVTFAVLLNAAVWKLNT